MSNTIKLMIVDDHDMLRSGIKVFIEAFDDIELLYEASDGEEALLKCHQQQPDVILMDFKMPRMDGVTAIAKIRQYYPDIQFIMLTSFVNEEIVKAALQAGAVGYLLKDAGTEELYQAIVRAYKGESMLAPEATQVLIHATTSPPAIGHDLTDREIEILELLVTGMSNSEIGAALHISRSTVKNHISNIFAKLQTDSRTEAAAIAIQHGIVTLDDPNTT